MGAKNSKLEEILDKDSFQKSELTKFKESFNLLRGQNDFLVEDHIKQIFKNDLEFGQNFCKFLRAISIEKVFKIDERLLLGGLEYLVKRPSRFILSNLNSFQRDQYETFVSFVLIVMGVENFLTFDLKNYKVGKVEAKKIFYHIFRIYSQKDNSESEQGLLSAVFEDQGDELFFEKFIDRCKQKLVYINADLKQYFLEKFLEQKDFLGIKKLEFESEKLVFKQSHFALLSLQGLGRLNKDPLQLLYDSQQDGSSFNRLSYALMGYSAPTIILLKHFKEQNGKKQECIFGGYMQNGWIDKKGYQGSNQNFLFQIYPHFEIFKTENKNDNENPPYAYLNILETPNYKTGLGFGGNSNYNQFRIWIDDDLHNKSHSNPDGGLYEMGYVVHPSIQKIKIETCEIWGLGNKDTLEEQIQFRIERQKEKEKMRKVDKTQFLNDIAANTNLFQHRDQLKEDIDIIKDEANKIINKSDKY